MIYNYNIFMFEEKSNDEILDEMLNILCKESEIKLPKNLSITDKRDVLNNLMLVRPIGYLDEYFVNLQNEFLKREMQDKLISLDNIKYNKKGMFISADILNLKADMIVIFTYRLFADVNLGTDNIDTELILRGGVNINEDFAKIYYDNNAVNSYKEPYIVPGYNLPSQYVAKILLPDISKKMLKEDEDNLKQSISNLFDFIKTKKLKIVAIDLTNFSKQNSGESLGKFVIDECLKNLKSKKIKINIIFCKK